MNVSDDTAAELIEVLERFCAGFAARDPAAVLERIAPDPSPVVVTSEPPLLRGIDELRSFLDFYVQGPTTYSWEWDRHDVSVLGDVGWLLAEGTETAAGVGGSERHPYRMTMVLERLDGRWLIRQVHGSSPQ
jgi:uncharacterized protein (TIGR02246 family)